MYQVLIVDDEPQIIHGLHKQVNWEEFNMTVAFTATGGEEALAIMETNHVDLLVADVCMPKMDGLKLITAAKQINPALRCIIISAFNEFEYVKAALQLGVDNYLLKPISGDELFDTLVQTLSNLNNDRAAVGLQSPAVHIFRTNILERWTDGSIQDFELYDRAEMLQITLTDPEYRVVVFDFSGDAWPDRIQSMSEWLELCQSKLSAFSRGEFFLNASLQAVCILHGQSLDGDNGRLADAVAQLANAAPTKHSRVFGSIGPVVSSYTGVHASYATALFYLNYRYIDTEAVYTFSESLSKPKQELSYEPSVALLKFENALRDENPQAAIHLARTYTSGASFASVREEKAVLLPLILSVVRMLLRSGRVTDELPESIVRRLAEFATADTPDKLKDWMTETIGEAMPVIHGRQHSYHLLVHHAMSQIRDNYHTGLSLKTLASAFNVSPAYLGQLFKEETGKYFHDYLSQIRLQESRTLLVDTDLKIGEIARRVGIPNQSYFNRIFKNEYGISPMEYRHRTQRP